MPQCSKVENIVILMTNADALTDELLQAEHEATKLYR